MVRKAPCDGTWREPEKTEGFEGMDSLRRTDCQGIKRRPGDSLRFRGALAGVGLISLLMTGCVSFQTGVDSIDKWQANRCDCGTPNSCTCGNANCEATCVSLERPEGYLSDGPTTGGQVIIGPPGKHAIDRMLELQQEVECLRAENESLVDQLALASSTIEKQQEAINSASAELKAALDDFSIMRLKLTKWYADLHQLDSQYRKGQVEQDRMWESLEQELQSLLNECVDPVSTTQAVVTPDAAAWEPAPIVRSPKNRVALDINGRELQ